ncbi:hypothetical protein BN126_3591 [Cronobacter sakazakii 680]|nr:hypothetical protein BN126_3591 [Cronobacter sakazakii 680]
MFAQAGLPQPHNRRGAGQFTQRVERQQETKNIDKRIHRD